MSELLLAVGADGARGGWLAPLAYGEGSDVFRVELRLVAYFGQLADLRTEAVPVAVDTPMGLLESVDLRPCDKQARGLLGSRSSTVFAPPSRPLLQCLTPTPAGSSTRPASSCLPRIASALSRSASRRRCVRPTNIYRSTPVAQAWLWECHPELSFRALADGEVLPDKKSVRGQAERLARLA